MLDKIIDIHCHILPEVDDGAQSWDESLNMVKQAVENGITSIIATPHYIPGELESKKEVILDKVDVLQNKIDSEGFNCRIYSGMELYLVPQLIEHFDEGKILSLAGSKYVLVEFPVREITPHLMDLLYEIRLRGYSPIIAHPERNMAILNNPSLINKLLEHKVLFQVNANSIIGDVGLKSQRLVNELVIQGLASFVASDAHSLGRRGFKSAEALASLMRHGELDLMNEIFIENGTKVLNNLEITNKNMFKQKTSIVRQFKNFFSLNKK